MIHPPALRRGDVIAVVAPSSPFERVLAWVGLGWLAQRYRIRVTPGVFARTGYLAGDDDRRRDELVAALTDPEVRAVLAVRGPTVTVDAAHGDSIAVNGVCLTVTTVDGDVFTADVMKETFDRSALGSLGVGDPVNLERAATVATRLGGHIVQGHVDGVGTLRSRDRGERWDDVRIGLPSGLSRYLVPKG